MKDVRRDGGEPVALAEIQRGRTSGIGRKTEKKNQKKRPKET